MAHKIGKLFENLGIAGWGVLEPQILAAMHTETPVLLIGDRGTSKTEFAYRLCRALQGKTCNFQKYDTADASLDDILGLPDLRKLEAGEVGYIGTGTSIWNKTAVIWTEINRASPMFQGKLLEVVRTGTIHGTKTTVQFQFADCNPPRATGKSVGHDTYFMQDALGARFFCVHVPRGSALVFEQAMGLTAQRDAFDNDNIAEIGKFCKDLYLLWLDYSAKSPSPDQLKQATKVVGAVMADREAGNSHNYFDVRAAIRTTNMVASLMLLHETVERGFDLIPAIVSVIVGNVPELNGILRNDKTQDDMSAWESTIKSACKNHIRAAADPAMQSGPGIAFNMMRNGTFDNVSINELEAVVRASANPAARVGLLRALLGKVQASDIQQTPDYRRGHGLALDRVITAMQDLGDPMSDSFAIFGGAKSIDLSKFKSGDGAKVAKLWFSCFNSP